MKQRNERQTKKKREKEIEVVTKMVEIYCRKKHKCKKPCDECQDLINYATLRTTRCPFMSNKTFCSNCKVHCYKNEYRVKIKEVMRFSGPWMLLYHPIMAINHVVLEQLEKRRLRKEDENNISTVRDN